MRLKQNLVHLPNGCDVVTFVQHDGKPPDLPALPKKELTLADLRDAYFASQQKKLEQTTLDGIGLHFDHLMRILGAKRLVAPLTRADLQDYVNKRSEEWIDPELYRRKRREKQAEQPRRSGNTPGSRPPSPEAPNGRNATLPPRPSRRRSSACARHGTGPGGSSA